MKFLVKYLLLFFFLSMFCRISGQECSTYYSSNIEDQMEQGPCYVFATVAALEAINGGEENLSEWYLWSHCVLDGYPANNTNGYIIRKIVEQINTIGALYQEDFYEPFAIGAYGCLIDNPMCMYVCEDNGTEYDFCELQNSQGCPIGLKPSVEENACHFEDYSFSIHNPDSFVSGNLDSHSLDFGGLSDEQKLETLQDYICTERKGVILIVKNYSPTATDTPAPEHAIYVHGINGSSLIYKDSWPGNPALNREKIISPKDMSAAYVITGSLSSTSCIPTNETDCDCELIGPVINANTASFSLKGRCVGSKLWTVSDNLIINSGGGISDKFLSVSLDSCKVESASINFSIPDCDPVSRTFELDPHPATPNAIVFAQDICPNEIVEINISDSNAPYPNTTYQWQVISGGSIQSGQGTPVIFVKTSEFGVLKIKVVAINNCGVSDFFLLTIPFSKDCDKREDNIFTELRNSEVASNQLLIFPNPAKAFVSIQTKASDVFSTIYSINGIEILTSEKKRINISSLSAGLYLIKVRANNHYKTCKLVIE